MTLPIRRAFLASLALTSVALAADWPQWGGSPSKNMVSLESGLPVECQPGKMNEETRKLDLSEANNLRWAERLGGQTYGNPTVAGGKIFVGTNNEAPRDPRHTRLKLGGAADEREALDLSCLYAFNEADGKFLWQLAVPKLPGGKYVDWENIGICSSPAVDAVNKRVYAVTNRCEVVCLDTEGLANGNEGPFTDEAHYIAGLLGADGKPKPASKADPLSPTDGDIVWRFDMYNELGIFPHYQTASSPLLVGGKLFICTSNSRDWNNHVPSPSAPALICLDARTGKLLGIEQSGISKTTLHSNWSSPAYGKVGDQEMVIFGGGDGWCYGFDVNPVAGPDGQMILKELWRCDANTKAQRAKKYSGNDGPSEIVATPVILNNRVYVVTGQNPENGDGGATLTCIDATKTGDITATGVLWRFEKIGRSLSTPAILPEQNLLFIADFAGYLFCLDLTTGKQIWQHDTEGRIWGSPVIAGTNLYLGNETGNLLCLAATKEKKVLGTSTFDGPIFSSAVPANGALLVATEKFLYSVAKKK